MKLQSKAQPQRQARYYWVMLLWLLLLLLAVLQVSLRSQWQTDLTAFLPQADSLKQQVLLAEVRRGNASRLWMISLTAEGAENSTELAQASQILAENLMSADAFTDARNSNQQMDSEVSALLFRYRYLLQAQAVDFSAAQLRQQINERLLELSMPIAAFKEGLISSDPTDSFLQLLERLEAGMPLSRIKQQHGVWFSDDGRSALLFARARSNAMDAEGQALAYQQLQLALADMQRQLATVEIQVGLAGAPLIALQTSEHTRAASIRLSMLAGVLMLLLLLLAYRSFAAVLLAALPPILAVVFATAISSLVFPLMHVLTLAFGVTLLGVALDYPVHILSQQRRGERLQEAAMRIWPTLRIGVLTSIFAFAALIWTDFEGIVRLGVFSIAGLATAALASRYLLPVIAELPGFRQPIKAAGLGKLANISAFRVTPLPLTFIIPVFIISAAVGLYSVVTWSDDIAELSPVPISLIQQEQSFRAQLHLPESATLILVYANSIDEILQREQLLLPLLEQAKSDGLIQAWEMAASLLPPSHHQLSLQALLPEKSILQQQLELAQQGLPFVDSAFADFVDDVEASKQLLPLQLEMLADTVLAGWLDSLVFEINNEPSEVKGFVGIVRFTGLVDADELQQRLDALSLPQTWLLQTRAEISQSLQQFRLKLSQLLLFAAVIIALALFLLLRQPARVLRILMAVSAAVIGAAWISWLMSGSLNLLHLLALILVAGIGIDYALFFTRVLGSETVDKYERAATLHALLVCLFSSTSVFFLLAISEIKVLASIGMVVSVGVVLAFVFSLLAGLRMNSVGSEEKHIYNKAL